MGRGREICFRTIPRSAFKDGSGAVHIALYLHRSLFSCNIDGGTIGVMVMLVHSLCIQQRFRDAKGIVSMTEGSAHHSSELADGYGELTTAPNLSF